MLISRGAQIFKTARFLNTNKPVATNLNQVRNAVGYRGEFPPLTWTMAILGECLGGLMYWWVFWNLWHGWEGVYYGHIPVPVPEHFTDEELGIPAETK